MEKKIELKIDNTLTMLVGNDYGRKICEEQIKTELDKSKKNVIIIPKTVTSVGISFVEGVVKALSDDIKRDEFYNYFTIEASESVENKFRNVIMMN